MPSLYKFLYLLKKDTEILNFGRNIIINWSQEILKEPITEPIKILDLGCGQGADLLNIKNSNQKNIELYGIENFELYAKKAESEGIIIFRLNLEKDRLPFLDNTFDIIIANQIFEHLKEIFWLLGEMSRVAKPNSTVIIGVPNLASLHNRIGFLFGLQPTSINPLSAHIRGFTKKAMTELVEKDEYFKLEKIEGSNFYPFPKWLSQVLPKIFPNLSVALFYNIIRTNKKGNYLNILNNLELETPFYKG